LSNADVVARRHMDLQKAFETHFLANQWPDRAAMFASVETLAHHFYFSPGAVEIAAALLADYNAADCSPPEVSDLVLLVGNSGWKETIFPAGQDASATSQD
jgi:hypothetical protein